jgi:hypothetical protein
MTSESRTECSGDFVADELAAHVGLAVLFEAKRRGVVRT